ncbi:MAG: lipid-A-disaccharide synthase [Opitutales bacterium]|nr:lipid-A-disaccharide synthase [Opitutales bacterium]
MNKPTLFPTASGPVDLLVVAGEASGDEHAARLVKDLKSNYPDLRISSLGGEELIKAGAEQVFSLANYAVVGLVEVIKNYSLFRNLFKQTLTWIEQVRPRCVLLVDYPGFNLRLAQALKERGISCKGGGSTVVLQYVSPQLWAWKPGRRFRMAEILDGLGIIFPFEKKCYADVSLPVSFVGHPFAHPSYQSTVSYDPSGELLLLPGSRLQPVSRILPVFLDAFEELLARDRGLQGIIPVAGPNLRCLVESLVNERADIRQKIRIVDRTSPLSASAALMSSGTMSLACAWAGVPGVIGYRAHPITYWIGKCLVGVPHLGMANLLLPENPPTPEFLQGQATGKILAREVAPLLNDPESGKQAVKTANQLHKLLAQPESRGAVDWLVQEGKLG